MLIDPITRIATLEPKSRQCRLCYGRGRTIVPQPCPTNGRGARGGKDGCKTCHGSKQHYNSAITEVCGRCNGINPDKVEDETLYDHARFADFADLVAWRVVDATHTRFTELGLCLSGADAISTVGDYGAHLAKSDEALIAEVRTDRDWTQWVKVVRKTDLRLCDAIAIVRRRNGYSLIPVWDDAGEVAA